MLVSDSKVVHKVECFLDRVLALLDVLEDQLEDQFNVVILDLDTASLSMVSHHLLELSNKTLRLLLTHVLAKPLREAWVEGRALNNENGGN